MRKVLFLLLLLVSIGNLTAQEVNETKFTMVSMVGKVWSQIDSKTGHSMNVEYLFGDKTLLRCVLSEERKTDVPEWQIREFYFSDTVVTTFDNNKKGKQSAGKYLVIKEKNDNDIWYPVNYEFVSLSSNKISMKCVYPSEAECVDFVVGVNTDFGTFTIDKLSGKQWRNVDDISDVIYFVSDKMIKPRPYKTKGGWQAEVLSWDYYLSDKSDDEFEHSKYVKKNKNGDFLIYRFYRKGEMGTVGLFIKELSKNKLVLVNLDAPLKPHMKTYVCE